MAGTLDRVLRVRALLEDVSRMELEKRSRALMRIEQAIAQERRMRKESYAAIFHNLTVTGDDLGHERVIAEVSAEIAFLREERFKVLAQSESRHAEYAREEFLARRKERRQVNAVLDAEASGREVEKVRRTQRVLDEWFSLRRIQTKQQRQS